MKVSELFEGTVSNSFIGRRDHKASQKKLATQKNAIQRLNDPEMLALRKKMKKMSSKKSRFRVVEAQGGMDFQFDSHPDGKSVVAVDANTYDGAPDAGAGNTYGMGANKMDAVHDLIANLENAGISPDMLQQALQAYIATNQGEQSAEDKHIMQQGDMEAERGMGIQDERPR